MTTHQSTKSHSTWWVILALGIALLLLSFASAAWYKFHFSMDIARSFEVAGNSDAPRVLIATQGSAFKDAVVNGVVEHLKSRSANIKVIDVAALRGVDELQWNAVVVIHTWEMRKPPVSVKEFIDRVHNRNKLVVFTTSGAGDFKMEGVDAISGASKIAEVPDQVRRINERVDTILNANAGHS